MLNFQNPYINQYMPVVQPVQPVQVVKVNGENGARAYQIGANSSALLLDESGLMVWLVTSDGAGYKTVSSYDITPHKATPAPDFGSLEDRIKRLEEIVNATADSSAVRGNKNIPADPADDKRDQVVRKPAAYASADYENEPAVPASYGNNQQVWRGRE